MATSLHFGPEWMRKAPAKSNSSTSISASNRSESPSGRATQSSAGSGGATGAGGGGGSLASSTASLGGGAGARRNPSLGNLSSAVSGASLPAVTSPGAFSFAAAAAGGNGTGTGGAVTSNSNTATDKEEALSYSHLSLYSSDDRSAPKSPLVASSSDANGVGKKKPFAGALSDMPIRRIGEGAGVPLSPSLGSEQPRGINARAFSGGSVSDKAGSERPGLFQRGSSTTGVGLGLGAGSGAGASAAGGAQSPTIPRERFGGIQGGVLSGVASQARKRKDSENGVAVDSIRPSRSGRFGEDISAFGEENGGVLRSRSRTSAGGFEGGVPSESGGGVAASQETTGSSLSARFKRDRVPGEGPIGPPADAGIGFGKFNSVNRKRERQASALAGRAEDSLSAGEPSVDADLAADVLSSLKLNDEQSSASSGALEGGEPGGGAQQDAQASDADADGGAPWSAETEAWVYRDPSGNEQGPFTGTTMQEWWTGNYFAKDLLMHPAKETIFVPLGQILEALGSPAEPFLVPPPSPWSALTQQQPEPPQQQQVQQETVPQQQQPFDQSLQQPQRHDPLAFSSAPSFGGQGGGIPFDGLPQGPSDFNNPPSGWGAPAVPDLGVGGGGRGWPSLDLGFANAAPLSPFGAALNSPFGAPSPSTPFGNNSLFGAGGLRQDDHLSMLRQRELQEQRHAAAAAAARGHTGPGLAFAASQFGGGGDAFAAPGANTWDAGRGVGWAGSQSHLQHHQPDAFSSPQLQHQQQHQQPFQQQPMPSPWGNGPGTPSRSHFDQQAAQSPRHFQPQQQQMQHQVHQPAQAPWSNDVQAHHEQQQQQLQQQQQQHMKLDPAPIGTPRRARSPVQPQAQDKSFADASYNTAPEALHPAAEQAQPAAAQHEPAPAPAPEPEPEEVWPQSPSAVEFAAEPTLEQQQLAAAEDFAASASSPARSKRSRRNKHGVAAKDASDSNSAATNAPGATGVRLLSQDAFRREQQQQQQAADDNERNQVALSNWLPESGSGSSASAKAPWAADAAAPATNSRQPSLSLRQIQEAEARQAEARRSAERAQRAAARSTSGAANDADLPATMTWGLASGRAGNNSSTPLEAPPSAGASGAAPVWNSATTRPAAKKTLTEIQEEERKRAQKVREQQAAQAAALRRGYADSAAKVQPSVAPSAAAAAGAGWSVVGAKPATPTAPSLATRPAAAATGATPRAASLGVASGAWATAGGKSNGAGANAPKAPQSPATKTILVKNSSAAEQATASQPSADFLRYCKEQLKGLNNVKTDDFIEMLLSFPLDPSPDVVEIIADSVYANSSTLDGRRFAADFVAKRKLDVRGSLASALGHGHASGSAAAGMGGARSASEVLKSKTGASGAGDFGGFKVVKTKGGKKRA